MFSNKNFQSLFFSQAFSLFGSSLSTIAITQLFFNLSENNVSQNLGIVLVLKMCVYIIGAPLAHHFLKVFKQRKLMLTFDLVRFFLFLIMVFVAKSWEVYILMMFINICSAGFTPIYQFQLSEIFDDKTYTKAVFISKITNNILTVLAPVVASILLLFMSSKLLFVINSFTFLISFIFIKNLDDRSTIKKSKSVSNVFQSINIFLKNKNLLKVTTLVLISSMLGSIVYIKTISFIENDFHLSRSYMSLAMASYALGIGIVSFFVTLIIKEINPRRAMILGSTISLCVVLLDTVYFNVYILFFSWFLFGLSSGLIEGFMQVILKKEISAADRHAYLVGYFSISHLGWLISYFTVGILLGYMNQENFFITMSFVVFLIFIFYGVISQKSWLRRYLISSL